MGGVQGAPRPVQGAMDTAGLKDKNRESRARCWLLRQHHKLHARSLMRLHRAARKNMNAQSKNSDRGNRTPGCRVRDGDVSHYTISDADWWKN